MSHLKKSLFKSAGITVSHFFSMLPSSLKYLYSVEPIRMHFPAKQPCTNDTVCNGACSTAHSIICTRLFRGKRHSNQSECIFPRNSHVNSFWLVGMHFLAKQPCTNDTVCNGACSIAHSIICTRLFRWKIHSDWFNGIEILQGGSMEKKWDTVIPADLKRLFVSGTYMSHRSRKG